MDIEKLYKILGEFIKERDWEQFHSLKNISASISIEANELLELFQWTDCKDSSKILQSKPEKIKEEIADIGIYLLLFCQYADIDLEKVILDKIKINSEKYPPSKTKGISKKYNELD